MRRTKIVATLGPATSSEEAIGSLTLDTTELSPAAAAEAVLALLRRSGYLPPADCYDLDLYQVWQSPFERGCLERYIDAAAQVLDQLLKERTT